MPVKLIEAESPYTYFDADVIVSPVNCEGVQGKGLAKDIAKAWPAYSALHKRLCVSGAIRPGTAMLYREPGLSQDYPRVQYIIDVSTKDLWRNPSRLPWIRTGAKDLAIVINRLADETGLNDMAVSVPALGCGAGGLQWPQVGPILLESLKNVRADLRLFAPLR